ncbi:hypothetical protein ACFQJ3_19670 [Salinibaculum sp. GCM10025337]
MKLKVPDLLEPIYYKSLHPIGNLRRGENIFDTNWDLCLILDACRFDLLQEVSDEYSFLSNPDSKLSVDSKTDAWTRKTFSRADAHSLNDTAYVSANPFSQEIPDESQLDSIDHVWEYGWDQEGGTVPPRVITDRAIQKHRSDSPESLLVHYLQPHVPFIPWEQKTPLGRGNFGLNGDGANDTWQRFRNSELSLSEVWKGYRENLRYVLDEVKLLLENVDAERVVITSDHGNGVGEWGIYGHPIHMPFSCVRKVPWVTTTAEDRGTHMPQEYEAASETTTTEKLRALGYVG